MTLRFAAALFGAALLTSGCGEMRYWEYRPDSELPRIVSPWPGLHHVSLEPVSAPNGFDPVAWTLALERAVLKVDGIQRVDVVSDEPAAASNGESLPKLRNGSQGLLKVRVLSFDPYYPPTAHVEVNLYVSRGVVEDSDDVLEMDRMGSPLRSVARDSTPRNTPWLTFQRVYSAADPVVAERLTEYAECASDWDRGLGGEDRILRVGDRFMEFVFYESMKACFAEVNSKEVDGDGVGRELLTRSAQ